MIDICKLRKRDNICIFIRHGEKDINNNCLTNRGKRKTIEFANQLHVLNRKILIYTSPENRCLETANILNKRLSNKNNSIYISNILGCPGIQVKNEHEYNNLITKMKCRDIFAGWKQGDYYNAIYTPDIIKSKITRFLESTSLKIGITIYISQSGTVACTGYALGVVDYNIENGEWVDFLSGYIFETRV